MRKNTKDEGGSRTWKAINRESLRAVRDELLIRRGTKINRFPFRWKQTFHLPRSD